jgi:hypothetical protein
MTGSVLSVREKTGDGLRAAGTTRWYRNSPGSLPEGGNRRQ